MRNACLALVAIVGVLPASATADVKQGVDAWSRGDYKAAVDIWRPLATKGDADAQFNLGQAYKLGRGVPVDLPVAVEWFRKAAVQGHSQAIDNYGLALFQDGKKAEALPWLEKSVARGEKRTQLVLGTMLFNGDGISRDWVRAYALVTRSSQQGLPQASQTLSQMDQYIPEAQRREGLTLARKYEADARAVAVATPLTAPAATAARPASSGSWRIQLGAFRDEGNARSLWAKVGSRTGGSPHYVQAGGITRLQAGGFASRSAAQAACTKSGVSCVVVAP